MTRCQSHRNTLATCRTTLAACALALAGCASQQAASYAVATDPVAMAADSAVRALRATERSITSLSMPPRTLAVFPFAFAGTNADIESLAYAIGDLLIIDLGRAAALRVVERPQIDAVMRELNLFADTARGANGSKGRLVGARQLVAGSLRQITSREMMVVSRLASTFGDQAEPAITGTVPLALDTLIGMEKTIAFWTLRQMGISLTPAEQNNIEQRPTRSLSALIAYGKGIRDEMRLDYSAAIRRFREATALDPSFVLAQQRLSRLQTLANSERRAGNTVARSLSIESISPIGSLRIPDAADGSFPRGSVIAAIEIILRVP